MSRRPRAGSCRAPAGRCPRPGGGPRGGGLPSAGWLCLLLADEAVQKALQRLPTTRALDLPPEGGEERVVQLLPAARAREAGEAHRVPGLEPDALPAERQGEAEEAAGGGEQDE